MLDLSTFIPTSLWALHFGKLTEYLWEHLAPLQYIPGSACWKALAANGDLSSESAAHFCIKTFLKVYLDSQSCSEVYSLSSFLPMSSHNITPWPQLLCRRWSVPKKHDPVYNLTIIWTPTACDARPMIYPSACVYVCFSEIDLRGHTVWGWG